jgi:hypothetical protein
MAVLLRHQELIAWKLAPNNDITRVETGHHVEESICAAGIREGPGEPNKGVERFIGSCKRNKINGGVISAHRCLTGFAETPSFLTD